MIYFKNPISKEVFAYDTFEDRNMFGANNLVEMTPEEVNAHLTSLEKPPSIKIVTMRQARLALLAAGKLSQVDAVIDSLPEPHKSAARIEWDYSSEVQRDKPFVVQIGAALGYTDEQLDQLFVEASKL